MWKKIKEFAETIVLLPARCFASVVAVLCAIFILSVWPVLSVIVLIGMLISIPYYALKAAWCILKLIFDEIVHSHLIKFACASIKYALFNWRKQQ